MSYNFVSIILPVHNQADHIGEILEEYQNSLKKLPIAYEIILVLNACRDNSLEICQKLADKDPAIHLINEKKGGWGFAVRRGLTEAKGDLVCYTNSARTNGRDLSLLLLYAVIHQDIVIKANRKIRDSWFRRLGSLLYNLECRSLFDLSYWDINGTPKVFPRSFTKLFELKQDDDMIDAEFNIICRQNDYPMLEVPIFSTLRHGGKTTTNYNSAIHLYSGAFQLWRAQRRSK